VAACAAFAARVRRARRIALEEKCETHVFSTAEKTRFDATQQVDHIGTAVNFAQPVTF
jgi:hypothetical protein